jgi:HSP20 family molecular chaperone IbpA
VRSHDDQVDIELARRIDDHPPRRPVTHDGIDRNVRTAVLFRNLFERPARLAECVFGEALEARGDPIWNVNREGLEGVEQEHVATLAGNEIERIFERLIGERAEVSRDEDALRTACSTHTFPSQQHPCHVNDILDVDGRAPAGARVARQAASWKEIVMDAYLGPMPGTDAYESDCFRPLFTIHETPDTYDIETELPRSRKRDVKVTMHRHSIEVSCGHAVDHDNEHRAPHFGAFLTRLPLKDAIDIGHTQMTFEDGVLHIHAPKAA